jgi:hypothetical protein
MRFCDSKRWASRIAASAREPGWRRRATGLGRPARGDLCISPRRLPGRWSSPALGDGWTLRVTLDSAYPLIIEECAAAIEVLRGIATRQRPHHSGANCINPDSGWKSWPCLLPQHGPGRKHSRLIELHPWQEQIAERQAGAFLRGLIQTDGWRGVNRVRVKGRDYEYPRYQFSNRSDDIRRLFGEACDHLAVEWRPWTQFHISVARRNSVATLDRYVGLKR